MWNCRGALSKPIMGRVTLIELLDNSAAEHGEQPGLITSGSLQLTHKELQDAIDKTAIQLRRIGVKPGNLVSLAFPNTLEVRCTIRVILVHGVYHIFDELMYWWSPFICPEIRISMPVLFRFFHFILFSNFSLPGIVRGSLHRCHKSKGHCCTLELCLHWRRVQILLGRCELHSSVGTRCWRKQSCRSSLQDTRLTHCRSALGKRELQRRRNCPDAQG